MTSFLVLHWGRLGAGPKITAQLADALSRRPSTRVVASMEGGADSLPSEPAVERLLVHTYRGRTQLVTRLPHLLRLAVALRRRMRRGAVDVYLSPMLSVWQSLALFVMVPRSVLAVSAIHDASQHPGDDHPVLDLARRLELARADVVVAFSEHSAERLRRLVRPGTPVLALPHGTEPDASVRPRRRGDRTRIGFFGRITEYKGITQFVDAVERIAAAVPGATGVVIGDGVVDEELRRRSTPLVDWRVGWVDAAAVDAAFDEFDLVLLPYQEASQSGVMALAAARGVPVVATPVGGLAEQAAHLGNVVLASGADDEAVAAAAVALLTDPAAYAERSRAGLESAAGTGWDTVAASLVEGLEEIGLQPRQRQRARTRTSR